MHTLDKLNKPPTVKESYKVVLDDYLKQKSKTSPDIFSVRRQVFTQTIDDTIQETASEYCVSEHELQLSAAQYKANSKNIPNISSILNSKDFKKYKEKNPNAKPLKFSPLFKKEWVKILEEKISPLKEELQ